MIFVLRPEDVSNLVVQVVSVILMNTFLNVVGQCWSLPYKSFCRVDVGI